MQSQNPNLESAQHHESSDKSGKAHDSDPIDTDFEALPKSENRIEGPSRSNWFLTAIIALLVGSFSAIVVTLAGVGKVSNTGGLEAGQQAEIASLVSRLVNMESRLSSQEIAIQSLDSLELGVDVDNGAGQIMANMADLQTRFLATEAKLAELEKDNPRETIDAIMAKQIEPRLAGILAAQSTFDSRLQAVEQSQLAQAQKLDLILEILAPLSATDLETTPGISPEADQVTRPDDGIAHQTEDSRITPHINGRESAQAGGEEMLVDATPPINASNTIPHLNSGPSQPGLERLIDIQKRAEATLVFSRLSTDIIHPAEYVAMRNIIAEIGLDLPEIDAFLALGPEAPPNSQGLMVLLEQAEAQYLAEKQNGASESPIPNWLDGFVTLRKSDPEHDALMATLASFKALIKSARFAQAQAELKNLTPEQHKNFIDYARALSERHVFDTVLQNARIAVAEPDEARP